MKSKLPHKGGPSSTLASVSSSDYGVSMKIVLPQNSQNSQNVVKKTPFVSQAALTFTAEPATREHSYWVNTVWRGNLDYVGESDNVPGNPSTYARISSRTRR